MTNDPEPPAPQWLIDALENAEADVAAGRTVPWSEVRAELMRQLAETEARIAKKAKVKRSA